MKSLMVFLVLLLSSCSYVYVYCDDVTVLNELLIGEDKKGKQNNGKSN